MKVQIRNQVAALFLLLPAATMLAALPATALAQPGRPEMRSLQVASDDGLEPGARLEFTVVGTPRAQVSVRVQGVQRNIPLQEVSRGVYTGSYTIKWRDRITESSPIHATLRARNRNVAGSYSFPPDIASPPVAVAPPPAVLRIDRFTVASIERIEPGAELRFTLNGMPGGVAEIDIPGVINNVPMREVRPGVYEGSYTIRRMDNLTPSRPIVATLSAGGRSVTSNLTQSLVADAKPPVIRNLSPRDGEAVLDRGATSVSATFDDAGGVGVDPKSVRVMLSGRNVTADSQITPQFFTYRADLPLGRYTVDVTARDLAGNAVQKTWRFDVVRPVAAAPVTVPLQITSHANNTVIEGGTTVVRGQTAPGALVDVKVSAIAALAGMFGVTQNVLSQRVQADGNGNFSFSFAPQFPLAGTRYEVTLVAHNAGLSTEFALVLFQR